MVNLIQENKRFIKIIDRRNMDKMRNISLILILAILFSLPSIFALDECHDITTASTNCEVVTPVIDCSTYDLYNPSHVLDIDNGVMTQIGTTGIYNFTFNKTTVGDWIILLCSNHTSVITIGVSDQDLINSINATIYNHISNINASLTSSVNTINSNLLSINTSIMNNVDLINTNLLSINNTLYAHVNLVNNNLISVNSTIYTKVDMINTSIINKIIQVNSSINGDILNVNSNLISINNTLFTKIGDINSSITNQINLANSNLISINGTLYSKLDTVNTTLFNRIVVVDNNIISTNSTLFNEVDTLEESFSSSAFSNATFIARSVWDYNLTAAGYSTNNTGIAGSIQRYIALTVYWLERLLP